MLVAALFASVLAPNTSVTAQDVVAQVEACSFIRAADGESAVVSWDPPANHDPDRYIVERSRNGGNWFWTGRTDAPGLTHTNNNLNPQDTYQYRIITRTGQDRSDPLPCSEGPPALGGPITATNCTYTFATNSESAAISWERATNDNADAFIIERSRNGGNWFWTGRTDAPGLTHTNNNLNPQDTYQYRIITRSDSGARSTPIQCTDNTPVEAPLAGPTSCTASRDRFSTSAAIEWEHADVDAVDRYIIQHSRNGGDWFWSGAVDPPTQTFTRMSLIERDDYAFRIIARGPDREESEPTLCQIVMSFEPIQLATDVSADPVATIDPEATGINISWLLDSEIHRPRSTSTSDAIGDLGTSILRFPYGHLADNYLWDIAPFGGVLEPRIASVYEDPGLLNETGRDWSWAVNPDGSFNNALDFDEFISIAESTDSATLVVVNAAAHKYIGGPTYDELRTTAVEWVRYAQAQGVTVDYWQIGNEEDHPSDGVLTANEYISLFEDFAAAMREVDPSIAIGPGLIGSNAFAETAFNAVVPSLDFAVAHQYANQWENYGEWSRFDGDVTPNITRMQELVDASVQPDLPILITETNSSGSGWEDGNAISTTKALAFFELLISQHEHPDVVSSLMWSTHNPFSGENFRGDLRNALFNTDGNELTPNGQILQIFGSTMLPNLLEPKRADTGFIDLWVSTDPDSGRVALHILNKEQAEIDIDIELTGSILLDPGTRQVFSGTGPDDASPEWTTAAPASIEGSTVSTSLPPVSLTVIELSVDVA